MLLSVGARCPLYGSVIFCHTVVGDVNICLLTLTVFKETSLNYTSLLEAAALILN